MFKQVILVRSDLKLPKGKLSVQVAHASLEAAMKSDKKIVEMWRKTGAKKVALKVKDEAELLMMKQAADGFKLKAALIKDAGKTVLEPGTITCLGIGPDDEKKIDKLSGMLKMV